MRGTFAISLVITAVCGSALAQDLPAKSAAGSSEADAVLFRDTPMPILSLDAAPAEQGNVSEIDVERAKAARDRAQQKSDRWTRLQRSGVVSKVEAERVQMQASQATVKYQNAQVARLRQQLADLKARNASAALVLSAEETLRTSESLAASAQLSYERMQKAAADLKAARRKAMSSWTSGTLTAIRRAEAELGDARAAKPGEKR